MRFVTSPAGLVAVPRPSRWQARREGYAGSLQASGMLPFGQRGPVATLEETSKRSSVMNADLQDW
jgi:hypothetical protein